MSSLKELPLTQERLKHLLHYNPDTGVFTWLSKPSRRINSGSIAGRIKPKKGYVEIGISGRIYLAHRLAWLYIYGTWPKEQVDHINGIRNDNRIKNLRLATTSQNQWNKKMQKNNTSGIKGVSWDNQRGKWIAQCWLFGKHHKIGRFSSIDDADRAIRQFREKHQGEFCNHGA